MSGFETIIAIVAIITLFIFAVKKFSNQVHNLAGDGFKKTLGVMTRTPLRGLFSGAAVTAAVQSSTAVTVMLVSLVQAGTLSFNNSLGVILGANIGTTITSQLVAFNILTIAPFILLFGFLLERFGQKYQRYGKIVFYAGLIFFCLSLIAFLIEPFKTDPLILSILARTSNLGVAIVVGTILTVVFQSSSLVSSLLIVLVGGGLLDFNQAFGMILGANIGTTSTVLIVSIFTEKAARRVAVAHLLFNVLGVLIFLPFIDSFSSLITSLDISAVRQVANAHLIFNLIVAGFFLVLINPFARLVTRIVR